MVRSWPSLTGYPPELLDLDLDLEADLGVDTVKQAEVFAAVRQRFGVDARTPCACATSRPWPTSSAGSTTDGPPSARRAVAEPTGAAPVPVPAPVPSRPAPVPVAAPVASGTDQRPRWCGSWPR